MDVLLQRRDGWAKDSFDTGTSAVKFIEIGAPCFHLCAVIAAEKFKNRLHSKDARVRAGDVMGVSRHSYNRSQSVQYPLQMRFI